MLSPAACCRVHPDKEKTVERAVTSVNRVSRELREAYLPDWLGGYSSFFQKPSCSTIATWDSGTHFLILKSCSYRQWSPIHFFLMP